VTREEFQRLAELIVTFEGIGLEADGRSQRFDRFFWHALLQEDLSEDVLPLVDLGAQPDRRLGVRPGVVEMPLLEERLGELEVRLCGSRVELGDLEELAGGIFGPVPTQVGHPQVVEGLRVP
jgi:hypothetical protein